MVATRLFEEPHAVDDCTALEVFRAKVKATNAGERDGSSTHGTGFERDIKIAIGEALIVEMTRRLTNDVDLRMRRHVVYFPIGIAPSGNHFAAADQHRSNRNFAVLLSPPCFLQGNVHWRRLVGSHGVDRSVAIFRIANIVLNPFHSTC